MGLFAGLDMSDPQSRKHIVYYEIALLKSGQVKQFDKSHNRMQYFGSPGRKGQKDEKGDPGISNASFNICCVEQRGAPDVQLT